MDDPVSRRRIILYYPSRAHATLSVTGTGCALHCKHCGGKYLENMLDASTPDRFRAVICRLKKRGVKGVLLSGGCSPDGEVRFSHLMEDIRELTRTGEFMVNVHTGFIGAEGARELHDMGIRNICIDVAGSRETIWNVYKLDVKDPGKALDVLSEQGFTDIIPHITVGLEGGKPGHETAALELIETRLGEVKKIVFLSLIPTDGTFYHNVEPVGVQEIAGVIGKARGMFPGTELILGCMKPHYSAGEILEMVDAGIDGIVNPSEKVRGELEGRVGEGGGVFGVVVEESSCCSF